MSFSIQEDHPTNSQADNDILAHVLDGYRFQVSTDSETAARALNVRREVYSGKGYGVPVPDSYDHRSWILAAEHVQSGRIVGTMRLTPRWSGPFECEEYFNVPDGLRGRLSVELNRFAILPGFRKGATFFPTVSLGLFKLAHDFLCRMGAEYMVIASRPQQLWTYQWMRFASTGLVAKYGKLADSEHELLAYDFVRRAAILEGHPFRDFFLQARYAEVLLPADTPRLDIVAGLPPADRWPIAVGQ